MTLWGNVVNLFYTAVGGRVTALVSFTAMRVGGLPVKSSWHGTSLTPIRTLHSTDTIGTRSGTTVTVIQAANSPFMTSMEYVAPLSPSCIMQFASIRSKLQAPFRVTLRGVISDISEMQFAMQEVNKRTFNLVDEAGMWIPCCAIGLTARSKSLANGNDVVFYYGTGRGSVGTSPGMIYFMKDSLAVQVGRRAVVPTKRTEITITSSD